MTEAELKSLRIELASKLWAGEIARQGVPCVLYQPGERDQALETVSTLKRQMLDTAFSLAGEFVLRVQEEMAGAESGLPSDQCPPEESVLHQAAEYEFSLNDGDFRIYHDPAHGMWVACISGGGQLTHWGGCRFLAPNGRLYSAILPPGSGGDPRTCWEPVNAPFSSGYAGPSCLFPTALAAARAAWIFQQGKYPGDVDEAEGVSANGPKELEPAGNTPGHSNDSPKELPPLKWLSESITLQGGWKLKKSPDTGGTWEVIWTSPEDGIWWNLITSGDRMCRRGLGSSPDWFVRQADGTEFECQPVLQFKVRFLSAESAISTINHFRRLQHTAILDATCRQPEFPAKPAAPAL